MKILPKRIAAALVLAPALVACVTTPTPYQPRHNNEGYSEQKLEANRYRIAFAGNSATPRETVENYVLYRAAEVTLANGYDHFVVTGNESREEPSARGGNVGLGFGGFSIGSGGGFGLGVGVSTGTGYGGGRGDYLGQADIVMFKGPKPTDQPRAFDARELRNNLEPLIARPQQGPPPG